MRKLMVGALLLLVGCASSGGLAGVRPAPATVLIVNASNTTITVYAVQRSINVRIEQVFPGVTAHSKLPSGFDDRSEVSFLLVEFTGERSVAVPGYIPYHGAPMELQITANLYASYVFPRAKQ